MGDRGIAGKEYYPISLNPLLLLHIPPHCTLLIFEIIATPSIPPSILPNIPLNCTLISGNDTHLLQKKNNNSQHHEMLPNVMCYFQISCVIAKYHVLFPNIMCYCQSFCDITLCTGYIASWGNLADHFKTRQLLALIFSLINKTLLFLTSIFFVICMSSVHSIWNAYVHQVNFQLNTGN